jgi:uncharacterized Zn finger protein
VRKILKTAKRYVTRGAVRCRECGVEGVKKETVFKGRIRTVAWQCAECGAAWPERLGRS